MPRGPPQPDDSLTDAVPFVRSATLGVLAYFVGYLLTFALYQRADIALFERSRVSGTRIAVWLFYNAHFVDVVESGSRSASSSATNLIQQVENLGIPEPVWYLVPVVVLVAGGVLAARGLEREHLTTEVGAVTGAALIAGYLPLAVAGAYLSEYTESQSAFGRELSMSVGPDVTMAAFMAGVGFPLVLGALGGAAYASLAGPNDRARGRGHLGPGQDPGAGPPDGHGGPGREHPHTGTDDPRRQDPQAGDGRQGERLDGGPAPGHLPADQRDGGPAPGHLPADQRVESQRRGQPSGGRPYRDPQGDQVKEGRPADHSGDGRGGDESRSGR